MQRATPSAEYDEYVLVSSGSGGGVCAHVVRFPSQAPLPSLTKPLFLHRRIPELSHLEAVASESIKHEVKPEDVKAEESLEPKKVYTLEDIAKIAPSSRTAMHNMIQAKAAGGPNKPSSSKFQKKTRQMFFGVAEEGEDPLARAKKKDPDRFPWILRDSKQPTPEVLVGSVEVDKASSDRVLLIPVAAGPGGQQQFIVTPVTKIHKLIGKPKFQTFTTEEAEEKMARQSKKGIDRWEILRPKTAEQIEMEVDGQNISKEERLELARQLKMSNPTLAASIANAHKPPPPPRYANLDADGINEEIDFDEVMSDDENPELGIENEDEAKEAKRREYGNMAKRANFEGLDGEREERTYERTVLKQQTKSKQEKKLLRALKKHDDGNFISDDEETNIYGELEQDSDSEPEEPKPATTEAAAAAASTTAAGTTAGLSSKPGTPTLNPTSPALPSPALAAKLAKQKKKEDLRGYDAESAARKAMFGGLNLSALNDIIKTTTVTSASALKEKAAAGGSNVTGIKSPSLEQQDQRVASVSPDLPKASVEGMGGTKIKLRFGGDSSSNGERKRKTEGSPNLVDSKKAKTDMAPPPPPSAAELLARQKASSLSSSGSVKKSNGSPTVQSGSSPNLQRQGSPNLAGKSGSPQLSATSPRLEELRGHGGANKRKPPTPTMGGGTGTPGLTPTVQAAVTPTPGNNSDALTERDIRALFVTGPKSIKEIVSMVKDKMKTPGNKDQLGQLLKQLCKKVEGGNYMLKD